MDILKLVNTFIQTNPSGAGAVLDAYLKGYFQGHSEALAEAENNKPTVKQSASKPAK